MAEKTIIWTKTAAKQRREILKYWNARNNSTNYSEKLIYQIASHLKVIIKHPQAYKSADYPETRESAMGNYSIYYKIFPDKIIVSAFWDNRQDPDKLLEILG